MAEPERIVINTGPLVALARCDALDVAARLPYEFLCPSEVRKELDDGAALGHPAVSVPWLQIRPLAVPLSAIATAALDLGEAAVLQLALELGIARVCLDDWKGRRAALAVGLKVTGSLGLLIRAKALGVIPAIRPLVERASREGVWYDAELLRRVLAAAGE